MFGDKRAHEFPQDLRGGAILFATDFNETIAKSPLDADSHA